MHEVFLRHRPSGAIRLGDCEVHPDRCRIRRSGGPELPVEPKAMAVLLALLERPGRGLSREELMDAVWPGRYVTGHVLSRCIAALRKALGDDARSPRYIETIHGRGYRALLAATPLGVAQAVASPVPSSGRRRRLPAAAAWCAVAVSIAGGAWLLASVNGRERPESRERVLRPATAHPGSELDPALSPDGTRLAFSWSRPGGGSPALHVAGLDGGSAARLIAGAGRQANPSWAPDGRTLAFTRTTGRGSGIYLVPAGGGAERLLTPTIADDPADLAWSADGQFLYFADRPDPAAPSAIVRLDTRTLERVPVSDPPPWIYGDRDLAVSPDGARVAFARAVLPGLEDLYVAEAGGGRPRRLTRDGASINGIEWLPGAEILFSSSRGGSSRLWRIAADGGEPAPVEGLGEDLLDPSHAGPASRLVAERRAFDPDVWLLRLAGPRAGERRRLAPSTRWDSAPAISPDGLRVAFVSDRSGAPAIWLSEGDFEDAVPVATLDRPTIGPPVWSPDGRRLGIAVISAGQTDLAVVDLVTGSIGILGTRGANEVCPLFERSGRSLLFSSDASGRWEIWRRALDGRVLERLTRGGALCPRLGEDGETLYSVRPGTHGVWRVPVAGGEERRVPGTERVPPWIDWAVGPGGLYLRPAGDGAEPAPLRIVPLPGATARPEPPLVPAAPFPGLGIAVAADGRFAAYAAVGDAAGDLVVIDGFD